MRYHLAFSPNLLNNKFKILCLRYDSLLRSNNRRFYVSCS